MSQRVNRRLLQGFPNMWLEIGGLHLLSFVEQTEQSRAGGANKGWIVLHKRPSALLWKQDAPRE